MIWKDAIYEVALSLPKDSSSGDCRMFVGEDVYRSEYIVHHNEDEAKTLSYTVQANAVAEVKFVVHWGLYSAEPSVLANDKLVIG